MKASLVFVFIMSSCLFGWGQVYQSVEKEIIEENYRRFYGVFDREIKAVRQKQQNDTLDVFYTVPEKLPSWLRAVSFIHNDSIYITGFSDPNMDSASGLRLARLRALILLSLSGSTLVSGLRDNFVADAGAYFSQMFYEYSEFVSSADIDWQQVRIDKTHRTQYSETIILAALSVSDVSFTDFAGSQFQLITDLYTQVSNVGSAFQLDEKLNLKAIVKSGADSALNCHRYNYFRSGNICNTMSFLNDSLLTDLPALNFRYVHDPASIDIQDGSENEAEQGFRLSNGLWQAFLTAMLSALIDETNSGSIHFRQAGDSYDELSKYLMRQFTSHKTGMLTPAVRILNNQLYLKF